MGGTNWDDRQWQNHKATVSTQTAAQIFTQNDLHDYLDPKKIKVRESCDSPANPNSTPIILAVDETGSMGILAETIIRTGLGIIMKEIIERKPIADPHLMCMAIGDSSGLRESAPIQMTQFEAGAVLIDQLKNFYIEGNGQGNGGEAYMLAWFAALHKTKCDAMIKRGKKGYLFTIGDERPHGVLTKEEIKRYFDMDVEANVAIEDLLAATQQNWEVFHLIVDAGGRDQNPLVRWRELLGERAIFVGNGPNDHEKLAEIIVSIIQVNEGHAHDVVANSWDGTTAITVGNAIKGLTIKGSTPALVTL